MSGSIDITNHHRIQAYHNGIKLIGEEEAFQSHALWSSSVTDLFNLPLNVAFLDTESKVQRMNESNAAVWQCASPHQAIGMSIKDIYNEKSSDFSLSHDQLVLQQEKLIVKEEACFRKKDAANFQSITAKMPVYDNENKISGVLALSLTLGINHFPDIFDSLKSFTSVIRNHYFSHRNFSGNIYLSKRENEVLNFIVMGKTARETGLILKLSRRTIEQYLENIKRKFNVTSKSELIEKAILAGVSQL